MGKIIFSISIILLIQNSLFADKLYYTVMAKSGLSIRDSKNLKAEKIGVAKFGEKVEVLNIFEEDKITFEQTEGFWIKVAYQEKEGFMFSGYLYPGEINFDKFDKLKYVIIDEIEDKETGEENVDGNFEILNYLNIIDERKWYGVNILDSLTIIEELEIEYNIIPEILQPHHNKKKESKKFYYNIIEPYPFSYKRNSKEIQKKFKRNS